MSVSNSEESTLKVFIDHSDIKSTLNTEGDYAKKPCFYIQNPNIALDGYTQVNTFLEDGKGKTEKQVFVPGGMLPLSISLDDHKDSGAIESIAKILRKQDNAGYLGKVKAVIVDIQGQNKKSGDIDFEEVVIESGGGAGSYVLKVKSFNGKIGTAPLCWNGTKAGTAS